MANVSAEKISKALNVKKLDAMLHHFERYNFIKLVSKKAIQLSFISENLKEFIRREWLFANLVSSDQPAFLFDSLKTTENFNSAFENIKSLTDSVPFSLVNIDYVQEKKTESLSEPTEVVQLLSNQFKIKSGTVLKNLTFCSPKSAEEHFYKIQTSRKIWWRKFAACPGRFINSTISSKKGDKSLTSEILAEFPWGHETVETIEYLPEFCSTDNKDLFEVRVSARKKGLPHLVTCQTILENMAFTFLCDAYENLNGENDRDFLRFDRRLAPYNVCITGTAKSSETVKDLEELSLLLAKQLRRTGLSVLLLPNAFSTNLETQVARNDAMGVPYTVLLSDDSLKEGMISIRSRDTTLKEHSHVSLVVEYLKKMLD